MHQQSNLPRVVCYRDWESEPVASQFSAQLFFHAMHLSFVVRARTYSIRLKI
jgi:hypothetical protein